MFDPSAPHIIILLIVVLLLFGSKRLPSAAKSLGESMHIFKKSVHGNDEYDQPLDQAKTSAQAQAAAAQQAAIPVTPAQSTFSPSYDGVNQQQLADLQRQVAELQRQNSGVQDSVPNSQQPF
jgi:sec-independent protein translocase protein TatA